MYIINPLYAGDVSIDSDYENGNVTHLVYELDEIWNGDLLIAGTDVLAVGGELLCLLKSGDFKGFALKNMDIVISTDNVILNLAGALGVKTYGLFNKYPNFRWFNLKGDNVGWYNSVTPLQVEENNCWADVFSELTEILNNFDKV